MLNANNVFFYSRYVSKTRFKARKAVFRNRKPHFKIIKLILKLSPLTLVILETKTWHLPSNDPVLYVGVYNYRLITRNFESYWHTIKGFNFNSITVQSKGVTTCRREWKRVLFETSFVSDCYRVIQKDNHSC